jgi:hypothetical protein
MKFPPSGHRCAARGERRCRLDFQGRWESATSCIQHQENHLGSNHFEPQVSMTVDRMDGGIILISIGLGFTRASPTSQPGTGIAQISVRLLLHEPALSAGHSDRGRTPLRPSSGGQKQGRQQRRHECEMSAQRCPTGEISEGRLYPVSVHCSRLFTAMTTRVSLGWLPCRLDSLDGTSRLTVIDFDAR